MNEKRESDDVVKALNKLRVTVERVARNIASLSPRIRAMKRAAAKLKTK